jgi:uncharacterized membrane protein YgcG
MKNIRFIVLVLSTLVLSACGAAAPAPATPTGGGKVEAMPVAFVGNVDSMAGDQWVVSGTTVTVDPAVIRDGPFGVGDRVKVEGVINADGSFTVSRVELPAPEDISATPQVKDDNPNDDHGNGAELNDDHGNDTELNDDHGSGTELNDDHGQDASLNDDHGGAVSPSNNNANDDHGGNRGKDSGGGKGSGSGKGSGGGGSDDGGGHN